MPPRCLIKMRCRVQQKKNLRCCLCMLLLAFNYYFVPPECTELMQQKTMLLLQLFQNLMFVFITIILMGLIISFCLLKLTRVQIAMIVVDVCGFT